MRLLAIKPAIEDLTRSFLNNEVKVITLENPLLSKQAVTSKGILVPYTNLQLNPSLNTQLDLFYSGNISFPVHGSQYVTN